VTRIESPQTDSSTCGFGAYRFTKVNQALQIYDFGQCAQDADSLLIAKARAATWRAIASRLCTGHVPTQVAIALAIHRIDATLQEPSLVVGLSQSGP
jgi:hypothetical protein